LYMKAIQEREIKREKREGEREREGERDCGHVLYKLYTNK